MYRNIVLVLPCQIRVWTFELDWVIQNRIHLKLNCQMDFVQFTICGAKESSHVLSVSYGMNISWITDTMIIIYQTFSHRRRHLSNPSAYHSLLGKSYVKLVHGYIFMYELLQMTAWNWPDFSKATSGNSYSFSWYFLK